MKLIIDTSIVMAVLLGEPERDAIISLTTGCSLMAPESLPLEVGNSLSAGFKQKRFDLSVAVDALESYRKMKISLKPIDLMRSVNICHTSTIYAYDAYMLELAERERSHLFTLDKGLKAAATKHNIKLLEI